MEPWILWIIIRLLVPLTILRWPFWGTALCAFVDMLDYRYLHPATSAMTYYQIIDKYLDTYYLGFAAYTSLSWKDPLAKKISIFSYLIRVVGVLFFSVTQIRPLLFIFPNFFENFFYFYHIYRFFAKRENLFLTKSLLYIVVPALLIPKLVQEYFVHIINMHPTELVRLYYAPFVPEQALVFIQFIIYMILPVTALIWALTRYRTDKIKIAGNR